MRVSRHYILSFVLLASCCFSHVAVAQKILSGTVVDAETGETLPAVTLFDYANEEGTITNAAGGFELRLVQIPAQIDIRHIGYKSQRVEITNETPAKIKILLVPATYTLEEVVVSGEDPAYNIMRKVIAKKAQWQKNLDTYSAESYSRFMLYSDFDLAQVQESIALNHWKKGEGTRSFVRARRMRPASASPMRFASTQNVPNFYDDTIEILGFELVGPTHPDALNVYTFTLGGYLEQDGKKVYDIYFSPRSGLSTAFIGHVLVLDEEYVLLKVQLRPSPDNVLPAPVIAWDAFYEQQFAPSGDSLWLPIDLQIEGNVSFGRLGVAYPTARYHQVSRLTRYVVNLPVPDSLFLSADHVVEAENVDQQDYLFRWNPGLVPMTPKEIEDVVGLDPRMTLGRSFRPMGVLANYTAIDLREERDVAEEEKEVKENFIGGMYSSVRVFYDRVDGYYLGGARSLKIAPPLTLSAEAGYGLSSELPAYNFSLLFDTGLDAESRFKFVLKGGIKDVRDTQYSSHAYSRLVNSVTTYVGWEDYFDYYKRKAQYGEIGVVSEQINAKLLFNYARERHAPVTAYRDRKGWFFGDTQRSNPAFSPGAISLFTTSLEIGKVPEASLKASSSGIRLSVLKNMEYNTDTPPFTRYTAEAAVTIPTFFQRRKWSNELHMRLYGATHKGYLPLQYLSILETSRRPISPFGAFKTLQGLPIKGEKVWAVYWEHDFSTSLFEMLGLWGIAQNGIGFTLHGAHGQALLEEGHRQVDPFSHFSSAVQNELGISLTHFFNLPFRVDVTKNFDQKHFTFGVGVVKKL